MMNRRNFIRAITSAIAGIAVIPWFKTVKSVPQWKPGQSGNPRPLNSAGWGGDTEYDRLLCKVVRLEGIEPLPTDPAKPGVFPIQYRFTYNANRLTPSEHARLAELMSKRKAKA